MGEEEEDVKRKALDDLLKDREHKKWLAERLRHWATLIAALLVAWGFLWEAMAKVVKQLLEQSAK